MRLEFDGGSVADLRSDKTRLGWVIGAGLEYALSANWSARLEYQYLDFGSETFSGVRVPGGGTVTSDYGLALHTVRAGVNHEFGGPVVARYRAWRRAAQRCGSMFRRRCATPGDSAGRGS